VGGRPLDLGADRGRVLSPARPSHAVTVVGVFVYALVVSGGIALIGIDEG